MSTARAMMRTGLAAACTAAMVATAALAAEPQPSTPAIGSPVSGTIMYTRADAEGAPMTLSTIAPDGSDPRDIVAPFDYGNVWSVDGRRIQMYALAPDGVRATTAVMSPDGEDRMVVTLPDDTLSLGPGGWTPDGRIVFEGWDDQDPARNGLYIGDPAEMTTLERITTAPDGLHDIAFSVSPDGTRVLFLRVAPAAQPTSPGEVQMSGQLFVADLDGPGLIRLDPDGKQVSLETYWGYPATWAPDSRQVTFVASSGGEFGSLYVVDVTTGSLRTLASVPAWEAAQWSPTDDRIAFSGTSSTNNGVVTVRSDGSDRNLLGPSSDATGAPIDPAHTCCPVWSADGSHLLFQVSDGGRLVDLYTMRGDGTDVRRLTNDPAVYENYSWGPDPARS